MHCTIPNKESDELHWRREDGGFLPYDAIDNYGVLTIPQAQLSDSGIYICYSEDSITGERIDSTPTKLEVNPIARMLIRHNFYSIYIYFLISMKNYEIFFQKGFFSFFFLLLIVVSVDFDIVCFIL